MKKNVKNYLLTTFFLLFIFNGYAQVGIGTNTPNQMTMLDVTSPDNDKGVLIPRMTEDERNVLTPSASEDGLVIYNITENCFNFWNQIDQEWKSVCGQLGKATGSIDCGKVVVNGVYVEKSELNSSHYLSVTIDVTKAGSYTIIGTTSNGYQFYGTGVLLETGRQKVMIPAQGIPQNVQLDIVNLNFNGSDIDCSGNEVKVNVLTAASTYTINCSSSEVVGVYKVGTALIASNYINVPVTVTSSGSWSIKTDVVDGISFSGSGEFTAPGNYVVPIYGNGTPSSTSTKNMTLYSNSAGEVSTSCSPVPVIIVIPKKKILAVGLNPYFGAHAYGSGFAARKFIEDTRNFGSLSQSVVKVEEIEFISPSNSDLGGVLNVAQVAQIESALLTNQEKADICIVSYSTDVAANGLDDVFIEYLNKGGILILFVEGPSIANLFQKIWGNGDITSNAMNAAGAVYKFPNVNNEILIGPFADIRGLYWGEDSSATMGIQNLPLGELDFYTSGTDFSAATSAGQGRISFFKHKNLNLIWFGDGGVLVDQTGFETSGTVRPFALDANNKPISKSYGRGTRLDTYNSAIYGNILAWALKTSELSGINKN